MNIIDLLKEEHEQLKSLMEQIELISDHNNDSLNHLFQEFKACFNRHDQAEDDIFYPALQSFTEFKKIINKFYQAHHVVNVSLLELRLVPYAMENWAAKFSVLKDSINTHIEQEEEILFPQISQFFEDDFLQNLGDKVLSSRK